MYLFATGKERREPLDVFAPLIGQLAGRLDIAINDLDVFIKAFFFNHVYLL